jgi:hypothetical protein
MCMFSKPITHVGGTNIFARTAGAERQFLVYSMSIEATEDLAMVLPLPVKPGTDEKGINFIDLHLYANFFEDLEKGFPSRLQAAGVQPGGAAGRSPAKKLEVIQVGYFEASFVPTVDDFARLDERFRLPEGTWKKLPGYRDYGFAVFKLNHGKLNVHPMAFSFPRRDPKSLFFPTVHIHDGQVHTEAHFDHLLYCQPEENQHLALDHWRESSGHARSFMRIHANGLLEPDQHCYQKVMFGNLANRDTFVGIDS